MENRNYMTAAEAVEVRKTRRAKAAMDTKRKKIQLQNRMLSMRVVLFFLALLILAVLGLLLPLRPRTSEVEKRDLEQWPTFTVRSFWDGSYFSQISTWYADTFPFRERLISADASLKNLYGLKGEQIIGSGQEVADEIPEGIMLEALDPVEPASPETAEPAVPETADPETHAVSWQAELEAVLADMEKEEEEPLVDGAIHTVPEQIGKVYVAGDTGFGLFYFNLEGANAYIRMIDQVQRRLDGMAQVYDILAPSSIGILLGLDEQEKMGISLQKDAMEYIFNNINALNRDVICVNAYENLVKHNSEYIYFRTDHHWTALGAYYAYEEFCKAKKIKPTPVAEYETMEFPNFLGTLYYSSNQAASLASNPDTVIAYVPKSTNDMMYISHDDEPREWNVIRDVSTWASSGKYNTFIGSDEPFAQIENPTLSDGSACLVIKESYGNAFVPFLVDHYQYTYVADHRYFYKYSEYGNNLTKLIRDKKIQDVIFVNTTLVAVTASVSNNITRMFP